jgi:hypothetical protein
LLGTSVDDFLGGGFMGGSDGNDDDDDDDDDEVRLFMKYPLFVSLFAGYYLG